MAVVKKTTKSAIDHDKIAKEVTTKPVVKNAVAKKPAVKKSANATQSTPSADLSPQLTTALKKIIKDKPDAKVTPKKSIPRKLVTSAHSKKALADLKSQSSDSNLSTIAQAPVKESKVATKETSAKSKPVDIPETIPDGAPDTEINRKLRAIGFRIDLIGDFENIVITPHHPSIASVENIAASTAYSYAAAIAAIRNKVLASDAFKTADQMVLNLKENILKTYSTIIAAGTCKLEKNTVNVLNAINTSPTGEDPIGYVGAGQVANANKAIISDTNSRIRALGFKIDAVGGLEIVRPIQSAPGKSPLEQRAAYSTAVLMRVAKEKSLVARITKEDEKRLAEEFKTDLLNEYDRIIALKDSSKKEECSKDNLFFTDKYILANVFSALPDGGTIDPDNIPSDIAELISFIREDIISVIKERAGLIYYRKIASQLLESSGIEL